MKTKIVAFTLLTSLFAGQLFAQDRTTVNATSSEISDNLDLRAVASIFGDSENLDDFENLYKKINSLKSKPFSVFSSVFSVFSVVKSFDLFAGYCITT